MTAGCAWMSTLTAGHDYVADTSRHTQAADDLRPKSSHSSFSGFGWRSDKAAAPAAGAESSSSFKAVHGSPGAESRDGDSPIPSSSMLTMLCEDRLDFQHVFEDAVPGMPSARATFQVRVMMSTPAFACLLPLPPHDPCTLLCCRLPQRLFPLLWVATCVNIASVTFLDSCNARSLTSC